MYAAWGTYLEGGERGIICHAVAEIPSFVGGFSYMRVLLWMCFTMVLMTSCGVLMCSDIIHDGYKSKVRYFHSSE